MPSLNIKFLRSCPGSGSLPNDGLPEVSFAGRSNVGKSSLLNRLNGGSAVARTSSKPGCTQFLNLYSVAESYYIVDLPGYGYARAPSRNRTEWAGWILTYLMERVPLRGVVLLVDARHPCLPNDMEMVEFLKERGRPYVIALTKSDKLKRGKLASAIREAQDMGPVIPISSITGFGMKELKKWLFQVVS
ncbi:MAG: ribosome biogenesis GTP-binding protein YsxC [Candidatus Fermentibacteraceae bacterium]|nr:ribosome biogenesis GTP-binding protein YsxC [Candidatus Fermentibacteraceae bacterium]